MKKWWVKLGCSLTLLMTWGCEPSGSMQPATPVVAPVGASSTAVAADATATAVSAATATAVASSTSASAAASAANNRPPLQPTAAQCINDTWLLTHFSVAHLLDKRHHEICCKKGVLLGTDDGYRCEMDWPSNDVPSCLLWTKLADQLRGSFAGKNKPKLVVANLDVLANHAKNEFQCTKQPAAP